MIQFSCSGRNGPRTRNVHSNGHECYREQSGAHHGEGLSERQRMEQLPFLAAQGEHGHKRQDNNEHRKEDGAANLMGGLECGPARFERRSGADPPF